VENRALNKETLSTKDPNLEIAPHLLGFGLTLRTRISFSRRRVALTMSSVVMDASWSSSDVSIGVGAVAVAMDLLERECAKKPEMLKRRNEEEVALGASRRLEERERERERERANRVGWIKIAG
jgi:hypothetical protein